MLAKIRRMYFRDQTSLREISRRTGLSRNTVRAWLRQKEAVEPRYPSRQGVSVLDPYQEQLVTWLRADSRRPKRERRCVTALFQQLRAQGYPGSYSRVAAFARHWKEEQYCCPQKTAYVPLQFAPGEAFQFDWSCEYAFVGGIRKRLEVAHLKLAHSRAFLMVAYPQQTHEMLFDAHARGFAAFGGVPGRGIYDNMKTAVDKVGRGKTRAVNARFQAMASHYLFEPDFCTVAAGWEKGIVEKNVQDRRRQLWQEAGIRTWTSLEELNVWLETECRAAWQAMRHPQWPELTVAEVWEQERPQLMPVPQLFDGYVEQTVRVSPTSLIHYQRNRYSVPVEYANGLLSLRVYPAELVLVADQGVAARQVRCFERDQTHYDWQHYLPLLQRKPGALRNGAPFADMPEPLLQLRRVLLKQTGGDRVMAQVLSVIPEQGLEAVLVAVELALEAGRVSGEHVLNVLARLQSASLPPPIPTALSLTLQEEPAADVQRYDALREALEVSHVA
jgi:transposase